jgi:hypothetical protein
LAQKVNAVRRESEYTLRGIEKAKRLIPVRGRAEYRTAGKFYTETEDRIQAVTNTTGSSEGPVRMILGADEVPLNYNRPTMNSRWKGN